MMPAFSAVRCAALQGDEAASRYQLRAREAFFAESRCISLRHVLVELAEECGLDVPRFEDDIDAGREHAAVVAETVEGWRTLAVRGSPTLVLPDGTQHFAPAMPHLVWARGHRIRDVQPADCPTGDCLDVLRGILDSA